MKLFLFRLALLSLLPSLALGAEDVTPPPGLAPHILPGTRLLAFAEADLDGDGLQDVVFILEKQKTKPEDEAIEVGERPLFIALRQPDGSLRIVKRNDNLVLCSQCGGVFGDPFAELEASSKRFSVSHYGGSAWRWSNSYHFAYSRIDRTWQLVRVEESSYHTANPDAAKVQVFKPPRHFGKIDVAAFDPQHFKGVGPK